MIRTYAFLFFSLFCTIGLTAQTADIQITPLGTITDTAALTAMEYTAAIWEQHLNSSVPIKVNVAFFPVSGLFLGFTFPNGRRDFPGAPQENTWYPSCLANALTGMELNPGESDMDIVIAADANWYFGTDGQPGPGKYDFVSVLLHEIGHGLGIVSLADSYNGEGSFGMIDFTQFQPFAPTFPIPQLAGLPGAYDRLLTTGSGQVLTDTQSFPNPSALLHATFTGSNVFYSGTEGVLANGGQSVKVFAPATFTFGTSISHLDESQYPVSSGNALMTPYIGAGNVTQEPGPIALGILHDIGWGLVSQVTVRPTTAPLPIEIWGIDGHSVLRLDLPEACDLELRLVDAMGRTRYTRPYAQLPAGPQLLPLEEALEHLSAGYYVVQVQALGQNGACGMVIFPE